MAFRGPYLFDGYISGRGRVRVFQDLDNSRYFFCLALKSDRQYYVRRELVKGIAGSQRVSPSTTAAPARTSVTVEQPALF